MADTIVAIATATGLSSISIVRVSGEMALELAYKLTQRNTLTPRFALLSSLYNYGNQLIDEAIVLYFQNPKSFTGEDIVEFQCHGGIIVAQEIVETLLKHGARLALAGEFSKRAFLNGKIDLTKAEAISKLIEAKSINATKILARQLKGELKDFIDDARESLIKIQAYSEVMIDYAEEDIPDNVLDNIHVQLQEIIKKITHIVSISLRRKGLIEGFRVAIVGKPNVGKSSLLNAMLNFERAIVSDIAGTTRDTIEEEFRVGTHIIRLIDTAGIRQCSDRIEKIGIERSLNSIEGADVIIAMFDNSKPFDDEDEEILNLISNLSDDKHLLVAINKSDLNTKLDKERLDKFHQIKISAKDEIEPLIKSLETLMDSIGGDEELMLISSRQIEAVSMAKNEIVNALLPLSNLELEFFSYHILSAIKTLSSISKPYDNEEILDKMFSEFCLGK
ncbi:MAG: tRNA uridine-5-carboxymethylaminomethyl(34) synthesis GTPase MnmE [Sulfurovum sp.]|nr:MAG: tRNA uridine-5-carboxymethylaminomethyl(34) synthesis GTPase MnmE [Sulfurovum sp.]